MMELTLGPLLFNWPAGRITDFYACIADEAPVDRVYLGEIVCGKRSPFTGHALAAAAERLERAGKTIVWSTLAQPATPRERRMVDELAGETEGLVEINDIGAMPARGGRAFVAGPLLSIYNEAAARELQSRGCVRLCANVELSLGAIAALAAGCSGLEIEIFAFGRVPLALSSRCHHARAHGLHKDSCQFVCGQDPDGMPVLTLDGEDFLAVNGVQTLSHGVQAAGIAPDALRTAGVSALRLSPHAMDMVRVASAFRAFADARTDAVDLRRALRAAGPCGPLVDGYLHGRRGMTEIAADA